jgi:hypothetical protein
VDCSNVARTCAATAPLIRARSFVDHFVGLSHMATTNDPEPPPSPTPSAAPPIHLAGGIITMLAGAAVFLGGIILHFGEKADRILLFPFVGRLTLLLGLIILAIGAALAGRRAGMALGILMVLGGIGLYGVGLAFVQQLGTRLYQLFGLLTVIIGLVIVYVFYGIKESDMASPATPAQEPSDPQK